MRKLICIICIIFVGILNVSAGGAEDYNKGLAAYTEKNYSEALKWFTKAAEQKNDKAPFYIGLMYEKGCGVAKNDSLAASWYRRSIDPNAWYNLGKMYEEGRGVARDENEAMARYTQAASGGIVDAWYRKGCLYESRPGSRNKSLAIRNYGVAAEKGHKEAEKALARLVAERRKK